MMLGVELVKDKATREAAPELRNALVEACYQRGLLVLGCGPNTLRFMPPLNTAKPVAEEALGIFEEALTEVERGL